jgi:hypothetical protein
MRPARAAHGPTQAGIQLATSQRNRFVFASALLRSQSHGDSRIFAVGAGPGAALVLCGLKWWPAPRARERGGALELCAQNLFSFSKRIPNAQDKGAAFTTKGAAFSTPKAGVEPISLSVTRRDGGCPSETSSAPPPHLMKCEVPELQLFGAFMTEEGAPPPSYWEGLALRRPQPKEKGSLRWRRRAHLTHRLQPSSY